MNGLVQPTRPVVRESAIKPMATIPSGRRLANNRLNHTINDGSLERRNRLAEFSSISGLPRRQESLARQKAAIGRSPQRDSVNNRMQGITNYKTTRSGLVIAQRAPGTPRKVGVKRIITPDTKLKGLNNTSLSMMNTSSSQLQHSKSNNLMPITP